MGERLNREVDYPTPEEVVEKVKTVDDRFLDEVIHSVIPNRRLLIDAVYDPVLSPYDKIRHRYFTELDQEYDRNEMDLQLKHQVLFNYKSNKTLNSLTLEEKAARRQIIHLTEKEMVKSMRTQAEKLAKKSGKPAKDHFEELKSKVNKEQAQAKIDDYLNIFTAQQNAWKPDPKTQTDVRLQMERDLKKAAKSDTPFTALTQIEEARLQKDPAVIEDMFVQKAVSTYLNWKYSDLDILESQWNKRRGDIEFSDDTTSFYDNIVEGETSKKASAEISKNADAFMKQFNIDQTKEVAFQRRAPSANRSKGFRSALRAQTSSNDQTKILSTTEIIQKREHEFKVHVTKVYKALEKENHTVCSLHTLDQVLADKRLSNKIISSSSMEMLRERETDNYLTPMESTQKWEVSDAYKKIKSAEKASKHNLRMLEKFDEEAEACALNVDYENNAAVITEQKAEKMYSEAKYNLFSGLNGIYDEEEQTNHEEDEKLWNEFAADHPVNGDYTLPEYPGSTEGPLPEHNPQHYRAWLKQVEKDETTISKKWRKRLGADDVEEKQKKTVNLISKDDSHDTNYTDDLDYFLQGDEKFRGETELIPFEKTFTSKVDATAHSMMSTGEISPLPNNFPDDWDFTHHALERWAIFRSVPQVIKLWKMMEDQKRKSQTLHYSKYNEYELAKTPSLWAYYNTLPTWARENPIVRNAFQAFEFNKPEVTMRNKEIALNYACSLILPMDEELERMMKVVYASNPVRLTMDLGKEMVAELPLWDFSPDKIGREHEEDNTFDLADMEHRNYQDPDHPEEVEEIVYEDLTELDPSKQIKTVKKQIEEGSRKWEIQDDGEEEVLQDFKTKPYPQMYEKQALEDFQAFPMDFYDNDDGFWDKEIEAKNEKFNIYAQSEMMVGRPVFKH